jgi:hypothetical protein
MIQVERVRRGGYARATSRGVARTVALAIAVVAGCASSSFAADPSPLTAQPAAPVTIQPMIPAPADEAPASKSGTEVLTETVRDTAVKAAQTFKQSLTGQSVILGVSHAIATLSIMSGDVPIEEYRSVGDLTPTIQYYAAPAEFKSLWPESRWSAAWVFDYGGGVGAFSGKQTDQLTPMGTVANGKVSGDFAYAVIGTSMWFIRDDPWLPLAFRVTGDFGVGTIEYQGDLNYTNGGTGFSGRIRNDGTSLQLVNYAGVELRLWKISISVLAFNFWGNGASVLDTQNGQKLASYNHAFRMDSYTAGYVFSF